MSFVTQNTTDICIYLNAHLFRSEHVKCQKRSLFLSRNSWSKKAANGRPALQPETAEAEEASSWSVPCWLMKGVAGGSYSGGGLEERSAAVELGRRERTDVRRYRRAGRARLWVREEPSEQREEQGWRPGSVVAAPAVT